MVEPCPGAARNLQQWAERGRSGDICALDTRVCGASLSQFPRQRIIAGVCNSFRSAKVYLRAITGTGHVALERCERVQSRHSEFRRPNAHVPPRARFRGREMFLLASRHGAIERSPFTLAFYEMLYEIRVSIRAARHFRRDESDLRVRGNRHRDNIRDEIASSMPCD